MDDPWITVPQLELLRHRRAVAIRRTNESCAWGCVLPASRSPGRVISEVCELDE